mgnify:CR=1 FL=1
MTGGAKMSSNEHGEVLALLGQMVNTITRLQARIDAAESLAVCLFARLPRAQQDEVMEAVLDRTEAVADAQVPLADIEAYRAAAQKLYTVLLAKRGVR